LPVLRPYDGNTICLARRPRSAKHQNKIGSEASNLITVPITPYNGTAVQNVSISKDCNGEDGKPGYLVCNKYAVLLLCGRHS